MISQLFGTLDLRHPLLKTYYQLLGYHVSLATLPSSLANTIILSFVIFIIGSHKDAGLSYFLFHIYNLLSEWPLLLVLNNFTGDFKFYLGTYISNSDILELQTHIFM